MVAVAVVVAVVVGVVVAVGVVVVVAVAVAVVVAVAVAVAVGVVMLPIEPQEWTEHAACKTVPDRSIFFPEAGSLGIRQAQLARQVCATCPVQAECLDFAIARPFTIGIWAGMNEKQRRKLRKERGDGRALKDECKHGHPFTEENTAWYGGRRKCRTCERARRAEDRARVSCPVSGDIGGSA